MRVCVCVCKPANPQQLALYGQHYPVPETPFRSSFLAYVRLQTQFRLIPIAQDHAPELLVCLRRRAGRFRVQVPVPAQIYNTRVRLSNIMADACPRGPEREPVDEHHIAWYRVRSMVWRTKLSVEEFQALSSYFQHPESGLFPAILKDCLQDSWRSQDETLRGYIQHRELKDTLNVDGLQPNVRSALQALQARIVEISRGIDPVLQPSAWSTLRICENYTGDKLRPSTVAFENAREIQALVRILMPLATIPIDVKDAALRAIDSKTEFFHRNVKKENPSSRPSTSPTPDTGEAEAATAVQGGEQASNPNVSEHSDCASENFDEEGDEEFEKSVANRMPLDRLDMGCCSVGVRKPDGSEEEVLLSRNRLLCVGGNLTFTLRARPCATTFFLTCTLHSLGRTTNPFTRTPEPLRMSTPTFLQEHLRAGMNTFTMERMRRYMEDKDGDNILVQFAPGKWCQKRVLSFAAKDSKSEPERKLG